MWLEGTLEIQTENEDVMEVNYCMKRFDEPSEYGISEGRISKLELRINENIVANYDRGWDVEPTCMGADVALDILLDEYN
ncbi:hypothetical protein NHG29_00225 [Aerococcaceae bacterium NML160702]|nr:hypothetical protein [Aerococcaceae bacterium NML160702]